jgi:hypothetical protein
MEIIIKREISQDTLKLTKLLIDAVFKPLRKFLIILFLFGIVTLLISSEDFKWDWITFLGIGDLILVGNFYFRRVSMIKETKSFISRVPENNKYNIITINDESFTHESFERKVVLQWNSFSSYKINSDNIMLLIDNRYSYIIMMDELESTDYINIRNLIASRIPNKKN